MAITFMKTGKEAQALRSREEAAKEAAMNRGTRVQRFWMPKESERQITFLDGALDEDGIFMQPSYMEHQMQINGDWKNWFVCTADNEPCPLCDNGNRPSLVTLFLAIDRTGYVSKKTGNTVKDYLILLAAKQQSYKMLLKKATKLGGLAGVTFDVSRTGDQSPAIGNDYDFVERVSDEDVAKILAEHELTVPKYEDLITYRSADELRKMGFGGAAPIGSDSIGVTESTGEDF